MSGALLLAASGAIFQNLNDGPKTSADAGSAALIVPLVVLLLGAVITFRFLPASAKHEHPAPIETPASTSRESGSTDTRRGDCGHACSSAARSIAAPCAGHTNSTGTSSRCRSSATSRGDAPARGENLFEVDDANSGSSAATAD